MRTQSTSGPSWTTSVEIYYFSVKNHGLRFTGAVPYSSSVGRCIPPNCMLKSLSDEAQRSTSSAKGPNAVLRFTPVLFLPPLHR